MSESTLENIPNKITLSVVLPTYNEQENIIMVISKLKQVLQNIGVFEILVVDDGSTDKTSYLVREYAQLDSMVHLFSHSKNLGYGAAVATGLREAKGALVFFSDSDGQFDFRELPQFLSLMKYSDMVVGYRLTRKDPFHRKLNSYLWTKLNNRYFKLGVRDLNCAFKLFTNSFVKSLQLDVQGASINSVILTQAREQGLRILQVPVEHFPRQGGTQTGAKPSVVIRALGEFVQQIL